MTNRLLGLFRFLLCKVRIENVEEQKTCRICCDNNVDMQKTLISPCDCSGSIAFVHRSCLERWVTVSNRKKCPVCRCAYAKAPQLKPRSQRDRVNIVYHFDNIPEIIALHRSCFAFIAYGPWLMLVHAIISLIYLEQLMPGSMVNLVNVIVKISPNLRLWCFVEVASSMLTMAILVHWFFGMYEQWKTENSDLVWANKKKKPQLYNLTALV